jgi:hypothetical protein
MPIKETEVILLEPLASTRVRVFPSLLNSQAEDERYISYLFIIQYIHKKNVENVIRYKVDIYIYILIYISATLWRQSTTVSFESLFFPKSNNNSVIRLRRDVGVEKEQEKKISNK